MPTALLDAFDLDVREVTSESAETSAADMEFTLDYVSQCCTTWPSAVCGVVGAKGC